MSMSPEAIDHVLAVLNDCASRDPRALITLVGTRVSCNRALAEHPAVQVGADLARGEFSVGVLGLLNGLCGVIPDGPKAGWGYITALINEAEGTICFVRTESGA